MMENGKIVFEAKKLIQKGIELVVVSMGAEGAVFVTKDSSYKAEPFAIDCKSTVGAGDSMVGGFVAGWLKTGSYQAALQWGIAAGSASAFCEGLATGEEIRRLYEEGIRIQKESL